MGLIKEKEKQGTIFVKQICISEHIEIIEMGEIPIDKMDKTNYVYKTVNFLNQTYNTKNLESEQFYIVGLSPKYQLKYILLLQGEESRVNVNPFQVLGFIWKTECKYFVCLHNHPNGISIPSDEDIQSMLWFENVCKQFGCIQLENVIITQDEYYEIIADEEHTYNQ